MKRLATRLIQNMVLGYLMYFLLGPLKAGTLEWKSFSVAFIIYFALLSISIFSSRRFLKLPFMAAVLASLFLALGFISVTSEYAGKILNHANYNVGLSIGTIIGTFFGN